MVSARKFATVFGASSGYVSNSNVPFAVSTTTTGPAPGDGCTVGAAAGFAGVLAGGFGAGCVPAFGAVPVFGAAPCAGFAVCAAAVATTATARNTANPVV